VLERGIQALGIGGGAEVKHPSAAITMKNCEHARISNL